MKLFSARFALVCTALWLAGGCSSSSDTANPSTATPDDAGGATDSSMSADASAAVDSAMATDAKPSTAPCRFAVSGDRTDPTTDSISCPGYLKQVGGMGDYTINVAAGFDSSTDNSNVTLGFTLSAAAAPKAGDVWTLGKDGCTGNLTLTVTKGQTGTIWATSDNSPAGVKSATTVTFGNVTMMKGTQRPQDVYYLFDVTLETTLLLQPGGSTTVKVSGHFAASALPLGA